MVRSVERLDEESAAGRSRPATSGWRCCARSASAGCALEADRGGASLPLPEQEVVRVDDHYDLRLRPPSAISDWNAQISLMTGMAAADIMLAGQVGHPADDARSPRTTPLARFRRQAAGARCALAGGAAVRRLPALAGPRATRASWR